MRTFHHKNYLPATKKRQKHTNAPNRPYKNNARKITVSLASFTQYNTNTTAFPSRRNHPPLPHNHPPDT